MQNMTQQYLLITALVVAMWPLSAQAAEDQSTEVETSFPRRQLVKPAHTQVDETIHRTDVIMVKFREPLLIRLREGSLTDLGTGALLGAEEVLAGAAQGRWERVHGVPEGKLDQWRLTAEGNLGKAVADLNLYFILYLPAGGEPGASIDAFNTLDCVELAMPVSLPAPPPADCCAPPPAGCCVWNAPCISDPPDPFPDFEPCQGYLGRAPGGIDAECMWMVPGGTGAGVKIVDVEWYYNRTHEDLNANLLVGPDWEPPDPDLPIPPGGWEAHGTSVLGMLGSIPNGWGTTGIAYGSTVNFATEKPDTENQYCNEPYEPCGDTQCAAISRALLFGELVEGDVLLLEQQKTGPEPNPGWVPVEWDSCSYNVIKTAVGLGITVVEAAGNGGQDLDEAKFCPRAGEGSHCPFTPGEDSGAIIVGAGYSPVGQCYAYGPDRVRLNSSTYGSTVDLQAWGNGIVAPGYGFLRCVDGGDNWDYMHSFGATSGATAIVAGACALLQSAYEASTEPPPEPPYLEPMEVRDLLRATGSLQQPNSNENIGPRPNLAAAIIELFGTPDCNCNMAPDFCDIASGTSCDLNTNGIPDGCDCPGELNCDGEVEAADLAILLGSWGPCPGCPADLNCDGEVEAADLAILLGSWGPCGGMGAGGSSGPEGPTDAGTTLEQALAVMGFADVDEFTTWTASVPTDEAHAATQQLLELLTQ